MNYTIIIGFVLLLFMMPVESGGQQQIRVQAQPWITVGAFNGQRSSHASVAINDTIYVFGGYFSSLSETLYYDDVQFFRISTSDGTVVPNSLTKTSSFSIARSELAVTSFNDYIYIVGGYSGSQLLNDVQYGYVESNGQVLSWETSSSVLNFARSKHQLEVLKTDSGKIYLAAISGTIITSDGLPDVTDTIEVAQIYDNGLLGQWYICPSHVKGARQWPATGVIEKYLYVMGGRGDLSLNEMFDDIQFAAVQENGCPGPWATSSRQLIIPLYGHRGVVLNSNLLVVLGGSGIEQNYFNNVQYATVQTDNADTTAWMFDRNQFLYQRLGHTSVQLYDTYVYVIGGQNTSIEYQNDILMSAISVFDRHAA